MGDGLINMTLFVKNDNKYLLSGTPETNNARVGETQFQRFNRLQLWSTTHDVRIKSL